MATIEIQRTHSMELNEVRDAAQKLVDRLEKEHGVTYAWNDDTVDFKCAPKGISGRLAVDPQKLDLKIKLGMLASMFEGPLRREIDSYLDKHIS